MMTSHPTLLRLQVRSRGQTKKFKPGSGEHKLQVPALILVADLPLHPRIHPQGFSFCLLPSRPKCCPPCRLCAPGCSALHSSSLLQGLQQPHSHLNSIEPWSWASSYPLSPGDITRVEEEAVKVESPFHFLWQRPGSSLEL